MSKEIILTSPTYGKIDLVRTIEIIKDYILASPESEFELTIGSDSRSYDRTKLIKVIALHKIGGGGIFFYATDYLPPMRGNNAENIVRRKVIAETQASIELADAFLKEFENEFDRTGFDYTEYNIDYQIHCDVGYKGKTNGLIPEITQWVQSVGVFSAVIKPDSFAASSIANKIRR